MENSKVKKYWHSSKAPHDLLYGIPKPTKVQLKSILKEKQVYCDGTYIPIIDLHFKDKKKRTIMEFGSGEGLMAKYMSPHFKKYICVDIVDEFLELCEEHTADCKNVDYELIKDYYFSDFTIKPKSIDIITSTHVLCHCNYFELIIYFRQFYKLLKKGGIILFDIYNSDQLDWKDDIIVQHTDLYKEHHILENLFNPLSSTVLKREIMKLGFEEIFDSVHENPGGWNLLGFKKVK